MGRRKKMGHYQSPLSRGIQLLFELNRNKPKHRHPNGMGSSDQFNIRWNNYTSVLQNVFRKLLDGEQFVDVTLACEGQSIKCHRVILSACSTYFDRLLSDNPNANMVIYLKDMKFWELRALVTFMYNGEVSISQQKLPHLCKAAEALRIKGLAHDTGLADGNLDRLEDDEMEEFQLDPKESSPMPRENHRNSMGQPKSLLRQHNNLSAFAAQVQNRQPPQQVKRKILSQPPKLVKMQRVESPANGARNMVSGVGGGNMKQQQQQHPITSAQKLQMPIKKTEPEVRTIPVEKETYEEDEETFINEVTAVTNIKEEDVGGDEAENDDMDGGEGEENESLGSEEGDDSHTGQTGRPKVAVKYTKDVRDSALNALQSGMTLRECSETYGVPRKTLSKWKSREKIEEESSPNQTSSFRVKEETTAQIISTSGIVLPPKTTMGAPVDSADRAERLKKATELALSGVTVRQAAAHYEIPRTTLCAYMKRRGLAGKRNFLPSNNAQNAGNNGTNKRSAVKGGGATGESNGQVVASSHYDDFPFLGISELMDEMGQGNYDPNEEYGEAEEEYSEK